MKKIFLYALAVMGLSALTLTSCSTDDPFITAGPDSEPHILQPDFPEGKDGQPALFKSLKRNEALDITTIVTPAEYSTVKWYDENWQEEPIAEGLSINQELMAGEHTIKIEVTTTAGKQASRTFLVNVAALDGDPSCPAKAKERWLNPGATQSITVANFDKVKKIYFGTNELTSYTLDGNTLTFVVPAIEEKMYKFIAEDEEGQKYGCGDVTITSEPWVDPAVKETEIWTTETLIDWDANLCHIPYSLLAENKLKVGDQIAIYYTVPEAEYHALRIIASADWSVDLQPQIDITGDTPNPFIIDVTPEVLSMVQADDYGFSCVGFGYAVSKISLLQQTENTLFEGPVVIDWDAALCNVPAEKLASIPNGSVIKIAYELVDAEYHALRIIGSADWNTDIQPQIDITGDTPNPLVLEMTPELKATIDASEGFGFSCVGFGYKVNKISWE